MLERFFWGVLNAQVCSMGRDFDLTACSQGREVLVKLYDPARISNKTKVVGSISLEA